MMKKNKFKKTEIGMIPEDWVIKEIGSFGKVITGKTPPTKDKSNFGNKYPFITPRDMKSQKFIGKTERYLSENGKDVVRCCLLPKNSVCVSCIGSDMGKVVMTRNQSVTNQQLNSIIPEIIDSNFVYYSIINISKKLKDIAFHSTAVPILNKSNFSKIKLILPSSKNEILVIAKILSSLDGKIELNNKINQILENIGQTIFKRWFIDFEFPNKQELPYKSSGGEIVESELGMIPKRWNVNNISKFGEIICGKTPPKSNKHFFGRNIPFIKIPDMHNNIFVIKTSDTLSKKGQEHQKNKSIPPGSVCVSCIATVGLVSITSEQSQTNQQINSIVPKEKYYTYYLYHALKEKEDLLKKIGSSGSATLNINKSIFSNIKIIYPGNELLQNYDAVVKDLFLKILNIYKENEVLRNIQDSLLPKLMSGKIRVNIPERNKSNEQ